MLLNDYLSLLPSATRPLPRFSALCAAVLRQAVELQQLVSEMETGFSLASAVGAQLDVLGESFGVERPLNRTDADYRSLLFKKLALWRWDGTNQRVPGLLAESLPGSTQKDNCDLSVTLTPAGTQPTAVSELFPVPAGVAINIS